MPPLCTRRTFGFVCAGSLLVPEFAFPFAHSEVITDSLDRWNRHPQLKKYAAAFEFLKNTDFKTKQPGRFEIDGKRMYATLSESKARTIDAGKLEIHRNYLDIHYLLDGPEIIGSATADGLELTDAYKPDTDVEFYKRPAKIREIAMKPGHFAVFMPGQGHVPGCSKDGTGTIRKVVVKSLV